MFKDSERHHEYPIDFFSSYSSSFMSNSIPCPALLRVKPDLESLADNFFQLGIRTLDAYDPLKENYQVSANSSVCKKNPQRRRHRRV